MPTKYGMKEKRRLPTTSSPVSMVKATVMFPTKDEKKVLICTEMKLNVPNVQATKEGIATPPLSDHHMSPKGTYRRPQEAQQQMSLTMDPPNHYYHLYNHFLQPKLLRQTDLMTNSRLVVMDAKPREKFRTRRTNLQSPCPQLLGAKMMSRQGRKKPLERPREEQAAQRTQGLLEQSISAYKAK